jgi:hypothetical protein
MLKNILGFICFLVTFCSCTSTKSSKMLTITQGISGVVYEVSGNQMPMIGEEPPKPKIMVAEILIYEKTNVSQTVKDVMAGFYTSIATKQIATTHTDSLGKFSIALPEGTYSLFIKINDKFYANLFNQYNDINKVTVDTSKITETTIRVNYKAVY